MPAMPEGALHGLPLRPPALRWDGRRYTGPRLQAFDAPAAQALPGVVAIVRKEHFIGVVAMSDMLARQAADSVRASWRLPLAPDGECENPAAEPARDDREADAPSYVWRLARRGADAAVAATAWCADGYATVWAPCPAAHHRALREELGRVLDLAAGCITVVDAGLAGGDTAHLLDVFDAAADAALLSQAVAQPVRVPLQGSAGQGELILQLAAAESELRADVPWAVRPSLARLLGMPAQAGPMAVPAAQAMPIVFDPAGTAQPLPHAAGADLDAALVFAQESLLDEQAARLGVDPLAHRLARLPAGPARRLAEQMAERAGWQALAGGDAPATAVARIAPGPHGAPGRLHGRGYASAQLRETRPDGSAADSWSAWVAEVAVEPATGLIEVTRVVVGHDSQDLQPAQGAAIRSQDPALLDAARRLLAAPAGFDDWGAAAGASSVSTGVPMSAPAHAGALSRPAADALAPPVDHGQLAVDGVLTLPAAAAIANAVFDATGVRLRQVPFDGEQLRLALASRQPQAAPERRWLRRGAAWLAAGASAAAGLLFMAWPAKAPIALTDGPDLSLYSAAAIERGRLVAAAGDCMACHTARDGTPNAGGLALETPFGTIYSSNITPDKETGIGRWSYSAFARAMREGVHRDGSQLYPAFPYTAFARMTEADMQALYAYLMAQPPVRSAPPRTELAFPYKVRPLLAGWNLLFHDNSVYQPDPAQSLEWNRGAYLVEGMGHCGACHTPRNALGAEKPGLRNYLAGGEAEGWEAPPLARLADAKVPWTSDDLFQYLRTGYSARHGVAAGPMAPVIHGLAQLPESDVRAISTYLMNLPGTPAPARSAADPSAAPQRQPAPVADASALLLRHASGERLYQNACATCHEAGNGPTLFGVKPLMTANTSVHAAAPDNLVQVILNGIQAPANGDLGYMPGFKDSFDDRQVADLLDYLRARFAPDEPAWTDSSEAIERVRGQSH